MLFDINELQVILCRISRKKKKNPQCLSVLKIGHCDLFKQKSNSRDSKLPGLSI